MLLRAAIAVNEDEYNKCSSHHDKAGDDLIRASQILGRQASHCIERAPAVCAARNTLLPAITRPVERVQTASQDATGCYKHFNRLWHLTAAACCRNRGGHVVERLGKHCPQLLHPRLRREDENIGREYVGRPSRRTAAEISKRRVKAPIE